MIAWVSASLRQFIVDRFSLDPKVVDDALARVAEEEADTIGRERKNGNHAAKLALTLERSGEATPELLYMAIREGEVALFLSMLARMANLDQGFLMKVAFDPDATGFAVVCRGSEIGKAYFVSILTLLRHARPLPDLGKSRDPRLVLSLFDRISRAAALEVVEAWRDTGHYPGALKDIRIGVAADG